MIVLRPADGGLPCVTLWLRPNRALSRRGLRRLIMVLAALALTTAGLGAWQGNVFAPLFALAESFAMAFALGVAWRAGDRSERITLDASSLEVQVRPGRRCTRFQSYWVRVRLAPGRAYTLSETARARLQDYDYPGNIRELRNILERAMLMADGDTLLPEHLPPELAGEAKGNLPDEEAIVPLETAELRYLQWALAHHGGDRKSLAAQLGISERTLYRKLAG